MIYIQLKAAQGCLNIKLFFGAFTGTYLSVVFLWSTVSLDWNYFKPEKLLQFPNNTLFGEYLFHSNIGPWLAASTGNKRSLFSPDRGVMGKKRGKIQTPKVFPVRAVIHTNACQW